MRSVMHSRSMNRNKNSAYRVNYGLHYIQGNSLPCFFSVTVEAPDHMNVTTGCAHDDVLAKHPDLSDIVALHLSDTDGVPMHALENAWYWWSDYEGRGAFPRGDHDRLDILAKHLRVTRAEVDALDLPTFRMSGAEIPAEFVAYIDAQRERWKAEADAAIDKYDLHGWDN